MHPPVHFGVAIENMTVSDRELLFRVLWKRASALFLKVDGKDNRNRRIFVVQIGRSDLF